ncbi:hypothetical protein NIES4075_03180 [Tolypothrix sp. NIES-4075]|nr:hypothetical protein NIES4075_03180 [Tolypothrix sp. NIES-4075]
MKPLLLYHQDLRSTNQLIEGCLLLIDEETRTIKNTYIASSGLPGNQSYDSFFVVFINCLISWGD